MTTLQQISTTLFKNLEETEAFYHSITEQCTITEWLTRAEHWKQQATFQFETMAIEVDGLLEAGVELTDDNRFNCFPHDFKMLTLLMKSLNILNERSSYTAKQLLSYGILINNRELVELVIPYVTEAMFRNSKFFHVACKNDQTEIVKLLLTYNPNDPTIHKSIKIAFKRNRISVITAILNLDVKFKLTQTEYIRACLLFINTSRFDDFKISFKQLLTNIQQLGLDGHAFFSSMIQTIMNYELLIWCLQQAKEAFPLFNNQTVLCIIEKTYTFILDNNLIDKFNEFLYMIDLKIDPFYTQCLYTLMKTECDDIFISLLLNHENYIKILSENPRWSPIPVDIPYRFKLNQRICLVLTNLNVNESQYKIIQNGIVQWVLHNLRNHTPIFDCLMDLLNCKSFDPSAYSNELFKQLIQHFLKAPSIYRKIILKLIEDPRVDISVDSDILFRFSAQQGDIEMVTHLLKSESRVNPAVLNNEALLLAVTNNHINVAKCILNDSRVDPSVKDNICLAIALHRGYFEFAKQIIKDPRVNPSKEFMVEHLSISSKNGFDVRPFMHYHLKVTPPVSR